jgi:DNA-binding GntR family transcriptional regulator
MRRHDVEAEIERMDPIAARSADRVGGTPDARPAELSTAVVHERLRRDILRGAFDPHEPISQVQLAKRLGVSRTPLREALRMLQREGLIHSEPNRRVRVTALTVADLEQLYAARVVVDSLMARLAVPRLTRDDVAEMGRRLGAMAALAASHDLEAWDVHHSAFHDLLKLGEGERLLRIARDLFDHTERYRHVYLAEPRAWSTAAREHAAVYQACLAGDAVAASRQVARHLGTTALTIIALAAPERDPVPVREALRMITADDGDEPPA